jgi:hypothetical protein
MAFAGARLANNDPEMAYMLIAGARDIMGLIHERFVSENLSGQRAELQRLSVAARDIGRIENADKRQKAITLWRDEFSKLSSILRDKEALSLYNRAELAKAVSS